MRAFTDQTADIRSLTQTETDQASGGLPTVVFGGPIGFVVAGSHGRE